MELQLQITFHGIESSAAITNKVRTSAQRLARFFDSIQTCHVAIEAPHHHHATGNHYRVRIEVSVPGRHLVVTHAAGADQSHVDVYVALREAFDAMRRQLQDYTAVLRRQVKAHRGAAGETA